MMCCSVGWDAADENKANPNAVPLLPCSQVNEAHGDSQVGRYQWVTG